MTEYIITGSFKVVFEDTDEENAVMQTMDNYLGAVKDDCDDWFKSVEFEFVSVEEIEVSERNIHKDCDYYNPKKDYCLKFFEEKVSEKYKVCKEYSEFNDNELARKWSN